uniref:Interferon-delta-8 n=1 Tax=Sus scrofa TaxID=9823 RepID=A0A8D0P612_PIG
MAHIYKLLAGVILCSIHACSLGQNLSGIENRKTFMILRQMKRIHSHLCLKDRTDFQFPWKRGNTTQNKMTQGSCYHPLMLQQIINLFNTENSRAAWNNALLDQLLSRLDHGLDQLEQMEDDNLACAYLGSVVRKYFQRIHHYLKKKEYSSCAWEVVRVEIEVCLSLI